MALCTSVVVHRAMLSMAATLALTLLLVLVHTGRAVDPAWDINGYRPRPAKSSRSIVYRGKVISYGGSDRELPVSAISIYDLNARRFSSLPYRGCVPVTGHSAIRIGDKMFIHS